MQESDAILRIEIYFEACANFMLIGDLYVGM